MFDYVQFLNYASWAAIGFFSLRLVVGISLWYDYELGKNKEFNRLKLALEGKRIKSYGVVRSLGFFILSVLVLISIK